MSLRQRERLRREELIWKHNAKLLQSNNNNDSDEENENDEEDDESDESEEFIEKNKVFLFSSSSEEEEEEEEEENEVDNDDDEEKESKRKEEEELLKISSRKQKKLLKLKEIEDEMKRNLLEQEKKEKEEEEFNKILDENKKKMKKKLKYCNFINNFLYESELKYFDFYYLSRIDIIQEFQERDRRNDKNDKKKKNVFQKKLFFGQKDDDWLKPPSYILGGISMSRVLPHLDKINSSSSSSSALSPLIKEYDSNFISSSSNIFSFQWSEQFYRLYNDYKYILKLNNPNYLIMFLVNNPHFYPGYNDLAWIYMRLGQLDKAMFLVRYSLYIQESSLPQNFKFYNSNKDEDDEEEEENEENKEENEGNEDENALKLLFTSNCFLNFSSTENYYFIQSLFLYSQILDLQGYSESSYCIFKLLLSLNPLDIWLKNEENYLKIKNKINKKNKKKFLDSDSDSDYDNNINNNDIIYDENSIPILLYLDYYTLKSKNFQFLYQLCGIKKNYLENMDDDYNDLFWLDSYVIDYEVNTEEIDEDNKTKKNNNNNNNELNNEKNLNCDYFIHLNYLPSWWYSLSLGIFLNYIELNKMKNQNLLKSNKKKLLYLFKSNKRYDQILRKMKKFSIFILKNSIKKFSFLFYSIISHIIEKNLKPSYTNQLIVLLQRLNSASSSSTSDNSTSNSSFFYFNNENFTKYFSDSYLGSINQAYPLRFESLFANEEVLDWMIESTEELLQELYPPSTNSSSSLSNLDSSSSTISSTSNTSSTNIQDLLDSNKEFYLKLSTSNKLNLRYKKINMEDYQEKPSRFIDHNIEPHLFDERIFNGSIKFPGLKDYIKQLKSNYFDEFENDFELNKIYNIKTFQSTSSFSTLSSFPSSSSSSLPLTPSIDLSLPLVYLFIASILPWVNLPTRRRN